MSPAGLSEHVGAVTSTGERSDLGAIMAALDAGQEPEEMSLLRVLRRPECPRELIDRLCGCGWAARRRRVAGLVVRHPACKHHFAWQVLPFLGWNDLHAVCRDSRCAPAIRAQAERKLADRLASMGLGERINLARMATRAVVRAMLADPETRCIEALIGNPHFTEDEAIRLVHANPNPECVMTLLRHPTWGRRREVIRAAVRSPDLPLGQLLGLAAALGASELANLVGSGDLPAALREVLAELVRSRRATAARGNPS